jgi:hypothetical protein
VPAGDAARACNGLCRLFGGAAEDPERGGYTTYTVESQHFSIAVPDSWNTASVDKAIDKEAINRSRGANPTLAQAVKELGKPSSVIKLLAFDPKIRNGFATNLNVAVTSLPGNVNEEAAL